jgi:hypothetical protein
LTIEREEGIGMCEIDRRGYVSALFLIMFGCSIVDMIFDAFEEV